MDKHLAPTERPRIAERFNYTPLRDSDFQSRGPRAFLQYRDLGLHGASGGQMRAEHIRMTGPGTRTGWHHHDLDFQYLYVLKGHVRYLTQDGQTITMRGGDGAHIPGRFAHDEFEFSPDFEVVQITAPADVVTLPLAGPPQERLHPLGGPGEARVGCQHAPAGTPQEQLQAVQANGSRVSEFAVSYDGPDAYKVGDGPRRFLAYRDAAATAATGRRVNINVVRNSKAGDSSTGWHYHALSCQFLLVLRGWARVEVEGEGEFTLRAGDAMTLPRGLKHDVTGFSEDFTVLELNIPADYDTIACDPPRAALQPTT